MNFENLEYIAKKFGKFYLEYSDEGWFAMFGDDLEKGCTADTPTVAIHTAYLAATQTVEAE